MVFSRLKKQLRKDKLTKGTPKVTLCLAAGNIASKKESEKIRPLFRKKGWRLIEEADLLKLLMDISEGSYENELGSVVSKLILRYRKNSLFCSLARLLDSGSEGTGNHRIRRKK